VQRARSKPIEKLDVRDLSFRDRRSLLE
jgi:hypothetical protein